ncbi:MAG: hypothetical protein IT424_11300 [Pirellulales bacterium]|nr:hypothetical protein [Pirellulales bacterium]
MSDAQPIDASLLPPRQFFRFSADVLRADGLESPKGFSLDESYALPALGELDGRTAFADVRMAWNPAGLAWQITVAGKTQLPWCRDSRWEDSDGLQVWIDTRATLNVHRASRFCHRFVYLPRGGGPAGEEPLADQLLINRAKENARPVRPRELTVRATTTGGGYTLWAFASTAALGGYDPAQQPRLGFTYAVFDRERGLQTFSAGPEFPYEEDPSCWSELRLVG